MKQWKQTLLALSGVTNDQVTKKEEKRPGYKVEETGKETPLHGEFTGDKFPTGGNPVKHEQGDWKAMNQKFHTERGKGEPSPSPSKKEFGSPLNDENGGRVERVKTKEELGKGAEPKYVTGRKQSLFRVGAKFGALKTDSVVTVNAVGVYGRFKGKVASNEITYLDPTGAKQPESDNMVCIAYRHSKDGKTYAAKVTDFFGAFVPLDKRAHKLDEATQAMIQSDLQTLEMKFKQYLAYDEPQYLLDAKTLCEQLSAQFEDAVRKHSAPQLDEGEMAISGSLKTAKSPPHSEYTVHEMKKHPGKIDNPFALAWWMKNKGKHLHETKPKDKKKSSWAAFFQKLADAVAPAPPKGDDKWPDPDKGSKNSWTNMMLDVAEIMDKDCTRDTHYAGQSKAGFKEAFEGAAPPFGSPEREEWESGKKKEPQTQSKDGQKEPDDQSKQAAVDFTQKPDGTINIAVEGLPDVPVQPADMGAMEAPVAGGGNAATPVTTPAASKGKSSSLIGRSVVDPILGNGKVIAVKGSRVIAAFADGQYETSAENLA